MVMRIRSLREAKGISQKQLANDMGVSPTVVCNWEYEVALPNIRQAPRLAKLLNCSTDDLYDEDYYASA